MLIINYFKRLIVTSITTLLISSYVQADEMKDKTTPKQRNDNGVKYITPSLKSDDYTINSLEWLREIGKKQVGDASYKMAVYWMQRQDWNKAKKLISEAAAMAPTNLQYLKSAMYIAYHQQDYQMAEANVLKILKIREKSLEDKPMEQADLLDNLAIIYKAQKRLYDAREIISKSLSISKENSNYSAYILKKSEKKDLTVFLCNFSNFQRPPDAPLL